MKLWIILFSLYSFVVGATEADPFKASFKAEHKITLLNYGLGSLEARLQMIERAKKTIDVEYFIYNLDKSGRIFSQALLKKAREGVKVRMLLDAFMVQPQFSPFYAHEMEKNGIEVKYYNTMSTFSFLFSDQYRNHRKVLLIDGEEAMTGGRNIADEYFDLREDYNFIDRDILVKGSIVSSIQKTFNQMWDSKLSVKVKRPNMPKSDDVYYNPEDGIHDYTRFKEDLERFNQKVDQTVEFLSVSDEQFVDEIRTKGKAQLAKEYSGSCDDMTFNSEYPIIGKKNRSMRIIKHSISDRIKNAKESILFDSPYFIVDSESSDALDEALKDKVKVRLLTNSLNSTDAIYVYDTFDTIVKNWIKKGLDPYIFKGDLPETYTTINDDISKARFGIHAKTFVFDNKDVVIGTYNFDPRSSNYNTEMTVSCDNNPELAKAITEDIEERIEGSILLDSSKDVDSFQFYNVSFMKKMAYYILKIPSNLFQYLL